MGAYDRCVRFAPVPLACVVAVLVAAPAGAATINDFPVESGSPAGAHQPLAIRAGLDGNLWFTDQGSSFGIGRMSTSGERIAPVPALDLPFDLAVAPNGTVYWTEGEYIGIRTPDGTVQNVHVTGGPNAGGITLAADGTPRAGWTFSSDVTHAWICETTGCHSAPDSTSGPRFTGLALGPDNEIWITGYEEDRIRRVTADNSFDLLLDLPVGSGPARIARGPDGNMWVTEYKANAIDRITPSGVRTRFLLPNGGGPNDITAGPDGALWFTEYDGNRIGRMTIDGLVTNEYAVPTAASQPWGITTGPDGNIWFTESAAGRIGRLVPDKPPPPPQPAGPVPDTVAPSFVSGLSFAPRRFRVSTAATPISAKRAPAGSVLSFRLSEPASLKIAIHKRVSGRRVGHSCRAPSKRLAQRRKCTRFVAVGRKLTRTVLQGTTRLPFSGRLGKRALAPGRYRATATATDAAGNVSKKSSASFTIVSG